MTSLLLHNFFVNARCPLYLTVSPVRYNCDRLVSVWEGEGLLAQSLLRHYIQPYGSQWSWDVFPGTLVL